MASRKQLEALITLSGKLAPSLKNSLAQANRDIGAVGKVSSFVGKTMGKAFDIGAKAVATGTALIGAGLAYVGNKGLGLASDLTEVQNVVDVTFGSNSKTIDTWSGTTLKSFGLTELAAKQYSSTMGAMLKSSGLSGDSILTMSKNLTGLSGDFASFYNKSPEDMFEAIQSGISGETEPLKRLGINMSVANLEAYALSKGIKTSYSQMNQASQMTLRYNYLLDASKDAQGDFVRTQGSLANQTRIAKANFEQLSAKLMTAAIPGFTKLVDYGNKLLDGAMGNPEFIQKFQDFISGAMDKVIELTPVAIDWLERLGPPIKGFYDFAVDTYHFIKDNWSYISPIIGGVVGSLLALELAAKGAFVVELLTGLWTAATLVMDGFAVGASAAAIAQDLLNLAWKTSPVGVIVTAIGLAVTVTMLLYKNWDKIWGVIKSIGSAIGKVFGFGDKSVNLNTNYTTTSSAQMENNPELQNLIDLGGRLHANGGFSNQPSIFGEAGLEVAIPIKYKSPRSLSLLSQTAKAIGADTNLTTTGASQFGTNQKLSNLIDISDMLNANGRYANKPSIFEGNGPENAIPVKYKNPRRLSLLSQTAKAIGADTNNGSSMPPISLVFNFNGPVSSGNDVKAGVESSASYIKGVIEDYFEEKARVSFGH